MRRLLWDISGVFDDIGVLFPLTVALVATNDFDPTALFLSSGLYIITVSMALSGHLLISETILEGGFHVRQP